MPAPCFRSIVLFGVRCLYTAVEICTDIDRVYVAIANAYSGVDLNLSKLVSTILMRLFDFSERSSATNCTWLPITLTVLRLPRARRSDREHMAVIDVCIVAQHVNCQRLFSVPEARSATAR
jgi:hypothetical protein